MNTLKHSKIFTLSFDITNKSACAQTSRHGTAAFRGHPTELAYIYYIVYSTKHVSVTSPHKQHNIGSLN